MGKDDRETSEYTDGNADRSGSTEGHCCPDSGKAIRQRLKHGRRYGVDRVEDTIQHSNDESAQRLKSNSQLEDKDQKVTQEMTDDRQRTHGGIHECLEGLVLTNVISPLRKVFEALGNHLHNLRPTEVPECTGQITDDLNEREQRSKEGINCRTDSPRQEGHKVLPPRRVEELNSLNSGINKGIGSGCD